MVINRPVSISWYCPCARCNNYIFVVLFALIFT